jgi:hypothetical protein
MEMLIIYIVFMGTPKINPFINIRANPTNPKSFFRQRRTRAPPIVASPSVNYFPLSRQIRSPLLQPHSAPFLDHSRAAPPRHATPRPDPGDLSASRPSVIAHPLLSLPSPLLWPSLGSSLVY